MNFPPNLKILVVADVDLDSVNILAEKFIQNSPTIDLIICCGPFCSNTQEWLNSKSDESHAIAHGDMTSIIATLEQIQCRVVYLPAGTDPSSLFNSQFHLTPNSINIYARRMALRDELYISGYTELSSSLVTSNNIDNEDSNISQFGFENSSSIPALQAIENIIVNGDSEASSSRSIHQQGIFVLNYEHEHTLSYFLFNMPLILEKANMTMCILHPQVQLEGRPYSSSQFPSKLGRLDIIPTQRLRIDEKYTIVNLQLDQGRWNILNIEVGKLD